MAKVVLRVRFIGGAHMDVTYEDPEADEDQIVERVTTTLASDSGVLPTRHGDRLVVIYARGVAAFEAQPRGAVL